MLLRIESDLLEGFVANAFAWIGDGSAQCQLVVRVDDELEVSYGVFDLGTRVEGHASVDDVGDALREKHLLELTALRIRAVEDGLVRERYLLLIVSLGDDVDESCRLLVGRGVVVELQLLALAEVGVDLLGDALLVVLDEGIGTADDMACGAVVLL